MYLTNGRGIILYIVKYTYQDHCRQMNQSALSHRTCVFRSRLGQERCTNELAKRPVMNQLETLHSHLPEVHEHLGTPLLPGTSTFFNCHTSRYFDITYLHWIKGIFFEEFKFFLTMLKLRFLNLLSLLFNSKRTKGTLLQVTIQ